MLRPAENLNMRVSGVQRPSVDPRVVKPLDADPNGASSFASPLHDPSAKDGAQVDVGDGTDLATAEALKEKQEREDEELVVGQAQGVLQHPDVRAWRQHADGVTTVEQTGAARDGQPGPKRADQQPKRPERPDDIMKKDPLEERLKRLIEHKMQLQQEKMDNLNQAIEAEIRAEEDPAYRGRYAFHTVKASMLTGQISDTEAEIVKLRMELARKKAKPVDYPTAAAAGML